MTLRTFLRPKCADAASEYEDAVYPEGPQAFDLTQPVRVAVGDGATSSSFSGLWARLLVQSYAAGMLEEEHLLAEVAHCAQRWRAEARSQPLPWFAAEKARRGAHAALVGLTIAPEGRWDALAVGDCCLFHIRAEAVQTAFPAARPDDLNSHPALLSTEAAENAGIGPWVRTESGAWREGDAFYLMSDALAAWFLDEAVRKGLAPWRWLVGLGTSQQAKPFQELIQELQSTGRMRVDDVTLAIITL